VQTFRKRHAGLSATAGLSCSLYLRILPLTREADAYCQLMREPVFVLLVKICLFFTYFNVCEQQFFNPRALYNNPTEGVDMLLAGLVGDSSQPADEFLTKQVTCHLFTDNPPNGLGSDLASLNIQRGRDHGIPGYSYSMYIV